MPMLKTPWRRARSLDTLVDEIEERFPGTTIWTVGDEAHQNRDSDHNSNRDGVICAIDVVGREQAKALWDFNLQVKDKRTKYQIHASKIVNSTYYPWVVRDYSRDPHTNHTHLSVGRGPDNYSTRADLYDDPSPWGFSEGAGMAALQVIDLQSTLNEAGFTDYQNKKLKEDDIWGKRTRSAWVKAMESGGNSGLTRASADKRYVRKGINAKIRQ